MNLPELKQRIRDFRDARDWKRFHTPKNLAISISLEAAELLEHFQWKTPEESEEHARTETEALSDEMADIAIYLIGLADNLGIDLGEAILRKLDKNNAKYPVEKSRGNITKYDKL
jgi:dCTP diphosphatase